MAKKEAEEPGMQIDAPNRDFPRRCEKQGGMAQSAVRSGSLYRPKAWWHGSVGRAHRSHRWGRWFESNCHHHSQALVDQGLASFLPYSHVRDLSLLTACSTNEAMRRWHGSVAVLEGERSDSFLILHWNQRIINCIKSANMIQPYARRP